MQAFPNPALNLDGGGKAPALPLGGMGIPLILFGLSVYFWESPIVYPIKLLTVFFHELSQGLAAVLTGGSMHSIELTADQVGLCWTAGGSWWLILSAGYLGSLLWGAGILYMAAKTRLDRELVQFLGVLLIGVTVFYVRTTAGVIFGLSFGAAMVGFASQFGEVACDQLLRYIGLSSMFYVILDIKSDLIDRAVPQSDAYRLAEQLHLPSMVVGVAWLILAIYVAFLVLEATMKAERASKPR